MSINSATKTCITCANYNRCNNPDKSFGFSCLSYKSVGGISPDLLVDNMMETHLGDDLLLPYSESVVIDEKEANKQESKLIEYLDSIIENPNPLPRDLKFDDSDFPEFPNFYEWCMSKEGANTPPFARQLAIGVHLFAEYCPRPTCTHPRFKSIYDVPYKVSAETVAENVTMLRHGICPKCGARKSELVKNGELPLYDEFAGAIGQRGGKSAMFSLFAPYIVHKYLKMQNPNRFFGLMQNTILSGTFVGLTFARAMSLLWTPILNTMRDESQWFIEYHKHMEALGERYGVTALVVKDTFIDYRHRRIRLYPSGPNKRTLRGDTRFESGIDEAGWFHSGGDDDEERERASGKEVHGALDRSLKTVRMMSKQKILAGYDNLITAYNMSISSPSHPNDLIMYLTNLYKGSRDCLAVQLPTWEFNPIYNGREDFKKEYEENYARAERDFGANPMVNENRAFTESEVEEIYNHTAGNNLIRISTSKYVHKGVGYIKPKIEKLISNNYPSIISLDAGEVDNSFTLTLIQRKQKSSPLLYASAIVEIMPDKDGCVINFNDVYTEVLDEILKAYNICGVVADRWQSTAILHRIATEHGVYVKTISAKEAHCVLFRSYHCPNPLVIYPKPELPWDSIVSPTSTDSYRVVYRDKPVSHLFHQFNTIQDVNGVYDKGIGNTDDTLRSVLVGVSFITNPQFADKYLIDKSPKAIQAVGSVGVMAGAMHMPMSNTNVPGIASSSSALNTSGNAQSTSGLVASRNFNYRR